MKKIFIVLSAIIFVACNPTAKLPSIQTQAEAAFNQSDFEKAYTLYNQYISLSKENNIDVSTDIYTKQAQSCAQLNKLDEAVELYNTLLKDEANIKLVAEYAQMLQSNHKANEEMELWLSKKELIKDENLSTLMTERLMSLANDKEDYQTVIDTYIGKGTAAVSKESRLMYITALEANKNGSGAAKACNALIKEYPEYTEALEWKAKYYYNKAEKRYKYEMNKYNKNKNATTYAYLRRDLKKVSADFRIARDTFLKLRKLDASDKSYIKYLKNIYLRLDMDAEAAKMDKLLK